MLRRMLVRASGRLFSTKTSAVQNPGTAEEYDLACEYPRVSLDAFYEDIAADSQLSNENALKFMSFAAKLARIRLSDDP